MTISSIESKVVRLESHVASQKFPVYSYDLDTKSQEIITKFLAHINDKDSACILELFTNERVRREQSYRTNEWYRHLIYEQQRMNICWCAFTMVLEDYIRNLPVEEKEELHKEIQDACAGLVARLYNRPTLKPCADT